LFECPVETDVSRLPRPAPGVEHFAFTFGFSVAERGFIPLLLFIDAAVVVVFGVVDVVGVVVVVVVVVVAVVVGVVVVVVVVVVACGFISFCGDLPLSRLSSASTRRRRLCL